jgi:inorganic pyrophosphatase
VPHDKLHPFYTGVQSYKDLPKILTEQIAHFFQHYKDLEKGKWVTISHWGGPEDAAQMIRDGIARVQGLAVAPRGRKPKGTVQRPARRSTDRPAKAAKKK